MNYGGVCRAAPNYYLIQAWNQIEQKMFSLCIACVVVVVAGLQHLLQGAPPAQGPPHLPLLESRGPQPDHRLQPLLQQRGGGGGGAEGPGQAEEHQEPGQEAGAPGHQPHPAPGRLRAGDRRHHGAGHITLISGRQNNSSTGRHKYNLQQCQQGH